MASFKEMLQKYVNADRSTLVAVARKSAANLVPFCKEVDKEHDGVFLLTSIIIAAIGADGILTLKEKSFLAEVLNVSEETISGFTKLYTKEVFDFVDQVADRIGGDTKTDLISLVIAVAACDETITREETAYIAKLID